MDFDINEMKIPIEKDGKIIECDMLFSFLAEKRKKVFIGYTDHSMKDGREMMYIGSIDLNNDIESLEPVTDPEELELVNEFLIEVDKEVNSGGGDSYE